MTPKAARFSSHFARLDGGKPGSGVRNVINGTCGESILARKSTVK